MITSYLQLIEQRYSDKLDTDAHEFIAFAVDGATRMKALINDLLTYSRVQRSTAEFAPVEMQQVLNSVLYNLQLTIEDTQAVITHDALPQVTANERQMTQLLQNLLSNALKFHGGAPPRIHVSVERQRGHWQFSVRDNGIGIEPEYHHDIFVIFQRLHTRDRYPGTGIGLAICRKIVEKHSGTIWVESQPGEGTTFYFTIPETPRKKRYAAYRDPAG
jgi:light-regulated signal transduction histidine kinase (bacteriophytochrome)